MLTGTCTVRPPYLTLLPPIILPIFLPRHRLYASWGLTPFPHCLCAVFFKVDAMPTLEVSSGDVDCTHGATVADIDENQAFYLQSRGISRREVRHPHTPTKPTKKPRSTYSSPGRSPSSSSPPLTPLSPSGVCRRARC